MMKQSLYELKVTSLNGEEVSLSRYQGKVLLIVNTATHSPLTHSYQDLERLYLKYESEGLEILDFPCNQFHGQAPESSLEINEFCKSNFHTTFPRFAKIDVKGEHISPLYAYLIKKKGFKGFDKGADLTPILSIYNLKLDPLWEKSPDIKGNFTKFLVSRSGKVTKRMEPTCPFDNVESAIVRLLDKAD